MTDPPLTGLRALEVGEGLAGPLTGMHLADLGMQVVRVERPGGDGWRRHEHAPGREGRGRHHLQVNRGKRAVAVDLARPEGQAIADELVRRSDVLVTNLRPGAPERLGLGWERCRGLNPRLIHCAITGFGAAGPLADRGGYAIVAEALAGLVTAAGATDERPPRPAAVPVADTTAPLIALSGVLAALIARERTGRGQRVEASLLGAAATLGGYGLVRLDEGPRGESLVVPAFARAYRTADGWLAVAAYSERLAVRLCAAAGLEGLLERGKLADARERVRRSDEIAALLAERLAARPTAHWDAVLAEAGVPAGPVGDRDDLLDHPQARAAGVVEQVDDPELGRITRAGPAVRLSDTPARGGDPGRALGADTRAVLRELGLDDARIDALAREGVVTLA